MDVVICNKIQAESILRDFFSRKPIITKVSKDDEDGIYFIEAITRPGFLRSEWQYRGYCCFGEVHKGDRRYDLNGSYSEELMKPLEDAAEKAIRNYEEAGDLFVDKSLFDLFVGRLCVFFDSSFVKIFIIVLLIIIILKLL